MSDLLTATAAAKLLDISLSTFYAHRARGRYRHAVAREPIGQRKYIAAVLDEIKRGETKPQLVHRRAS